MTAAAADLEETITLDAVPPQKRPAAQVRRVAMAALHDLADETEA